MNDDEEFWNLVGERSTLEEAAKVGDAVNIERRVNGVRSCTVSIIREIVINEDGSRSLTFTDPFPGEQYAPPTITIVGGS